MPASCPLTVYSFSVEAVSNLCCQTANWLHRLLLLRQEQFRHSNFADAARRWEDQGGGGAGGFWFQLSLSWRSPRAPRVCLCTISHNCYKFIDKFVSKNLATWGDV